MNDQETVVSVNCVCCLESISTVSSPTSKTWQRYLSPCCYQAICNDCQADLVLSHSDGLTRATFSCPNCQLSLPGTLSDLAKPTDRFITSLADRVKIVVTTIANITLLYNSAIQAAKDQLVEIKANHDQILSQGIFTTQQVADLTQQFQTMSKPVLKVIDSVIANNNSLIKQLASLESYCQGLEAVLRPGCDLDLNILLEISLNLDTITQRLQTSQPEISPGGRFSLIYSQFGPRVAPDRLPEQLRFLMSKEDGRVQHHNIQPATPSPLRVWTYPNITATLATIGLDLLRASYGLVELPGVDNFLLYFCDRDLNAFDQPRLALVDSAGRLIHHRNGYRLHHVNHKWLIYQAGTKLYVDYIENCHDGTDRTAKIVTAELDLAEVKLIHTRILGLNLAIDLYLVSCHGRVCQYLIGNDRRPYHCYFDPENGFLPRHEPRQYFQTDDTNVYYLGNGAVIGHDGDNSYYRTIIYTADGDGKVITEEYQGFRRWFRFKSSLRLFSNGSLMYLEEGGQVFRPGDIMGKLSELKVTMY